MNNHHQNRSLFWPIILVGAGVILLLRNLEIIPAFNMSVIWRMWPLLLVVAGLELLFGRRAPWVGGLIGLLAVGGVVAFLVFSPALGIPPTPQTETEVFSTPLEEATSAKYYFETAADPVLIHPLSNSDNLIYASIIHRGTMNFDASGTTEKSVRLTQSSSSDSWLVWDFSFTEQKWDIGITPEIPVDITLDGGSGSLNLDLAGLNLSGLTGNFGSGASRIVLPASTVEYVVAIESGSGSVNMTIPADTTMSLSLDSGSGAVHIDLPSSTGLRIEVMDDGSGSLNLPGGLERVDYNSAFSTGTWQTSDFDSAAHKITVKIVNRGSGSISIN